MRSENGKRISAEKKRAGVEEVYADETVKTFAGTSEEFLAEFKQLNTNFFKICAQILSFISNNLTSRLHKFSKILFYFFDVSKIDIFIL